MQKKIRKMELENIEINYLELKMKNKIGEGAFESVYEGIYGDKKVAVKVFHLSEESKRLSLKRSFAQEIYLLKDLDHPNIVKFIGATENMFKMKKLKKSQQFNPSLDCCFVTEFLPRRTLHQYIIRHHVKKLPINVVIQLALDVADGLSYLHSNNIMHRDLKTDNMLLDKNGRVKMIDFGLSKIKDLSQNTQNTGTLGFMAPELLAGSSYNHKCDVFSFGICLWEIFCCPYQCETMDNLNLCKKVPTSCPNVLAYLMKQCWDADPEKRPEMKRVVEILREFEASTLHQAKRRSRLSCFSS